MIKLKTRSRTSEVFNVKHHIVLTPVTDRGEELIAWADDDHIHINWVWNRPDGVRIIGDGQGSPIKRDVYLKLAAFFVAAADAGNLEINHEEFSSAVRGDKDAWSS